MSRRQFGPLIRTGHISFIIVILSSVSLIGVRAEEANPADALKALDFYADGIWKADDDVQTPTGQTFPVAFDLDWFAQDKTVAHMTLSRISEDGAPTVSMIDGYYFWHPEEQSPSYISFSFDGRLNKGDMQIKENGDMIIDFVSSGQEGRVVNLRIERMVIDQDTFNESVSVVFDADNQNTIAEGRWRRLPE